MQKTIRTTGLYLAVAVAAIAGLPAHAQTASSGSNASRSSWLPYTNNGYVGLSVGRSHYSLNCGSLAGCDDSDTAFNLNMGGMFTPYVGAEIGYLNMGKIDLAGGSARAEGINLSLVGKIPVGSSFNFFGKIGTTYGRTRVNAPTGFTGGDRESGWGAAYALGASWDFNDHWSAVLDVQRHRFEFVGNNDEWVRSTNLGLQYRF